MVDVTNNMFLIQSRNKYLNAQEFNTILIKNPASLRILTKADNALHYVHLNEKPRSLPCITKETTHIIITTLFTKTKYIHLFKS